MDEIKLQVARHRLEGIAEEMGEVLRRTAFSANIKERRDYSCAIAGARGRIISQAAHIPVHLGAMPTTMNYFLEEINPEPGHGYLLNDPYQGGTHLPDISFLMPWYRGNQLMGWVINRAHHTDIGGSSAGSMSVTDHVDKEGFRTGPQVVYREGELQEESIQDLLEASRTPEERITDLEAQIASAGRGLTRLDEWEHDTDYSVTELFDELIHYSSKFTRHLLRSLPDDSFTATDRMDGDGMDSGPVKITVRTSIEQDRVRFDFSDTDSQVQGNINCPRAVTVSSVYYVLHCLLDAEVPLNSGIHEPVGIETSKGTVVDVRYPGAVAGGNVETSQRIVDVILKALSEIIPERIPAASQGTMNNVSIGVDMNSGKKTYYETLGGGSGAAPDHDGLSARQVHMTNTLNTPIEEFERNYPLQVSRLQVREGSGGTGDHNGGNGIVKTWTALDSVTVSLLTERRSTSPYGLHGGEDGEPGENLLEIDGEVKSLGSKLSVDLTAGDNLVLKTPGGGGWCEPDESTY